MSNGLGTSLAAGIIGLGALGVYVAPHAAAQEGCHWSGSSWVYSDGSPCRGTGEDPTTDSNGNPACANGKPAQINLYTGRIDCTGQDLGPAWDLDAGSYVESVSHHGGGHHGERHGK